MKKGIFKKLTPLCLAFCLALCIFSTVAFATDAEDDVINDETMLIIPITSETPTEATKSEYEVEPAADYEPSTDPNIVTGKTRRSFYRDDKVDALRANIEKYSWAQGSRDYYTKNAEMFLGNEDKLWKSVTTQELPRSYYVGYRADPNAAVCRYCGCDLSAKYGSPYYAWIMDAWNNPWKVQCPDCTREFPSNDFGSFYELGIDTSGNWSYSLAKSENQKLVRKGKKGYLVNTLYPEKGTGWGVDDGYGYVDKKSTFKDSKGNTLNSTHTYISFYNHWAIWHTSLLYDAADFLGNAYLYTGDIRYGRAGAILIDRIADVYPDMTTEPYRNQFTDGGHYAPRGKTSDYIWENQLAKKWSETYDAVWPAYEDEEVITFLSDKAEQYGMTNDKTTPAKIRKNIEDGILREIYECYKVAMINGNFGMPQSTVAIAAVVLDTMPETKEMIDFIFQDGESLALNGALQANCVTGGNINRQLFNAVDANGVSDEVAPNYSDLWIGGLDGVINYLEGYDKYPEIDLYNNPRYVKMYTNQLDMLLRRKATVQIGDSGATAKDSFIGGSGRFLRVFKNTKDPRFAQALFHMNGRSTKGLVYGVFDNNPEALASDVQAVIDTYGEYNFDKSVNLTDYGFAHIKSVSHENVYNKYEDSERSFWMYYGRYAGHGHRDALNLGIEAKGLSVAPELGYPDGTTGDRYDGWGKTTVTHNTVIINDNRQAGARTTGFSHHFDGTEKVKVMDASAEHQYGVDTYRRTVVSVDIDDENSYGLDFFHVKGGNEHLYSFHALSDTIAETKNLTLVPQTDSSGNYVGTYRGADYTYGQFDNIYMGYNYLYNVDRAKNVSNGNFMVDFKIEDFRNVRGTEQDTHLRMTMINNFDLSEVAIADGNPPNKDFNPEKLKFVLARRSGSNLNTLFTTVFEPYDDNSAIESIENANIARVDGKTIGEAEVRALKITLKNGRVDYVTMAKDNSVEYIIDDFLNVKGFVTVYSMKNGENVYSYVNDGTKVGDLTALDAYNGSVVDFTKGNKFENSITVSFNTEVDAEDLIGRFMYVNREGTGNATYEILGVTRSGDNYILNIGDITLIDKLDDDGNFVYNISAGNTFRIPLSKVKEPKKDIYYNFVKAYNYGATNYTSNGYAQKITYDMTTEGSAYELNKRIPSAPWAFHSYTKGGVNGNDYYKYNESSYGLTLCHNTRENDAQAALKIKVEEAGSYIPFVNVFGAKNYDRAGFAKVSIKKLNTDGTMGDIVATRDINTANYSDKDHYVALSSTPVTLNKGEYVLDIEMQKIRGVFVIDGLSLVEADEAVASEVVLGYDEGIVEVNKGSVASTSVTVTMSDGSKVNLDDLKIEFTDDDVASCTVLGGEIYITGLETGTTTMTVRHGRAMARTSIKVNAEGTTVTPGDLYYNFLKSMPEYVNSVVNNYYSNTFNYAGSTSGAYGEVREDLESDSWAVVSKKNTSGVETPNLYFSRLYVNYGILFNDAGTVTMRIKVPTDGKYQPAINVNENKHAVAATYSIKSLDGTTTYSSKTIGANTTAGEVNISDAPIDLQAGDYLLVIDKPKTGKNFIDGISLDYKGEMTTPKKYTVTLNEGGKVTATYGEAMPSIDVPVKDGYIFDGYFDGENGAGKQYYKADGMSAAAWDKNANATLYAKWVEGDDKLGTKGVFMRNLKITSGTTTRYAVYLFSGIDDHRKYDEVGFEVTINGTTKKLTTKEACHAISASNGTVSASTLGAKCTRIFGYRITFAENYKDTGITYRAYAIDEEGNTIYGKYITIDKIYNK